MDNFLPMSVRVRGQVSSTCRLCKSSINHLSSLIYESMHLSPVYLPFDLLMSLSVFLSVAIRPSVSLSPRNRVSNSRLKWQASHPQASR